MQRLARAAAAVGISSPGGEFHSISTSPGSVGSRTYRSGRRAAWAATPAAAAPGVAALASRGWTLPIFAEDVGDDFCGYGFRRCEEQVIDDSLPAVTHGQGVGNETE